MAGYVCSGCGAESDISAQRCEYCGNPFRPSLGSSHGPQDEQALRQKQAELEARVGRNPADWQAWRDLGEACHHLGQYERADQCLRRGAALRPDDAPLLFLLAANAGLKSGWQSADIESFAARALALDSKLGKAQALIHISRGVRAYLFDQSETSLEKAIAEFQAAALADPENPYAYYYAGWVHELAENFDHAADMFRKATTLALQDGEPGVEEARMLAHLGQLYQTLGRNDEARKCLDDAVSLDPENDAARRLLDAVSS